MVDKKDKEIVKKEVQPLARTSGEQGIASGFDEMEQGDYKMPRLAILQGLSQIVIDGKAKMGQLANSLTKEVYGDSIEIIPLFMFKSRVQFKVGEGLVMLSRDNKTVTFGIGEYEKYIGENVEDIPGVAWDGKTPPTFSEVFNFPVLLTGDRIKEFPICLSLMKTGAAAARNLLSMARFANEDIFARVYTLRAEIEKNEKGTYSIPIVEFKRRCDETEYMLGRKYFTELYKRKHDIAVDLEQEEPLSDPNLEEE